MGDLNRMDELEKFSQERSRIYTKNLLEEQILTAANNSWDKGNYKDFIDFIDQTNQNKLSSSYKLKYKIANKRLKK